MEHENKVHNFHIVIHYQSKKKMQNFNDDCCNKVLHGNYRPSTKANPYGTKKKGETIQLIPHSLRTWTETGNTEEKLHHIIALLDPLKT